LREDVRIIETQEDRQRKPVDQKDTSIQGVFAGGLIEHGLQKKEALSTGKGEGEEGKVMGSYGKGRAFGDSMDHASLEDPELCRACGTREKGICRGQTVRETIREAPSPLSRTHSVSSGGFLEKECDQPQLQRVTCKRSRSS